jgi:hypothetical protein
VGGGYSIRRLFLARAQLNFCGHAKKIFFPDWLTRPPRLF